jgi:hypothetical protein
MLRNSLIVTVLVAASACMSGCGVFKPAPVVHIQAVLPPQSLLANCPHAPRPKGTTVADMAQALIDERAQLEGCDWGDKAALRTWASGNATPASK